LVGTYKVIKALDMAGRRQKEEFQTGNALALAG